MFIIVINKAYKIKKDDGIKYSTKNELLTGITLAQELAAVTKHTRRFIVVKSYDFGEIYE